MKTPLLILLALFVLGCRQSSYIKIKGGLKEACEDPCRAIESKGEAATVIARQIADNIKTKTAMTADVFKRSKDLYALFVLMFVGGLVFWGLTKSSFGWVIPAASVAGILVLVFAVNYAVIVSKVLLVIGFGLLIWKAIEYHQERDIERALSDGK